MDVTEKFLPGLIKRRDLPNWFIIMADTRSRGSLEYIIWDNQNTNIVHADYFIDGEFLESIAFEVKPKPKKRVPNGRINP